MRAILLVALAACTTTTVPEIAAQHGRCTTLEGRTFTSVDPHECGLGPTGPTSCNWTILFELGSTMDASGARWRYSDVEVALTVTCDGAMVTSASPAYAGTYDSASGVLVWDGFSYRE